MVHTIYQRFSIPYRYIYRNIRYDMSINRNIRHDISIYRNIRYDISIYRNIRHDTSNIRYDISIYRNIRHVDISEHSIRLFDLQELSTRYFNMSKFESISNANRHYTINNLDTHRDDVLGEDEGTSTEADDAATPAGLRHVDVVVRVALQARVVHLSHHSCAVQAVHQVRAKSGKR